MKMHEIECKTIKLIKNFCPDILRCEESKNRKYKLHSSNGIEVESSVAIFS